MSAVVAGYSATEVCRITGATYRQLDYWMRTGLVPGEWLTGSGCHRIVDPALVPGLTAAVKIQNAVAPGRISGDHLRMVIENPTSGRLELWGGVAIAWPVPEVES